MLEKSTIGPAEAVEFPELGSVSCSARIDTGARTSAIWASFVEQGDGKIAVKFFGKNSPLYSNKPVVFKEYAKVSVTSSTGVTEERYKVRLLVKIGGRQVRAWFTLANRSRQVYPVLIGRNVMRGKFVVDVSQTLVAGSKS